MEKAGICEYQVEPLREAESGRARLMFDENLRPKSSR